MSKILDISFIIGLLLTLTKGADLLLLERQKKWIDERFKTIASRVDSTDPFRWFSVVQHEAVQITILVVGALLLIIIAGLNCWPMIGTFWQAGWKEKATIYLSVVTIIRWGVSLAENVGELLDLPDSLLEAERIRDFLKAYSLTAVALSVLLLTYFGGIVFFAWLEWEFLMWVVILLGGALITPTFIWLLTHIVTALPVLLFSLFVCASAIAVFFMKGLFARILEYNKGVYAALVLIITIILGAVELWRKMR